jgi:hypothetical protein
MSTNYGRLGSEVEVPATTETVAAINPRRMTRGTIAFLVLVVAVAIIDRLPFRFRPWRTHVIPAARKADLAPKLKDSHGNVLDLCTQPNADCSGKDQIFYYDDGTSAIKSVTWFQSKHSEDDKLARTEDGSTLVVVRVDAHGETSSALEYKTAMIQKFRPNGNPDGPRQVVIVENGKVLDFSDGTIQNMRDAAR